MIEVPLVRFNQILNRLSDPEMVQLPNFDLLLYPRGWRSKHFYDSLRKDPGVEVLWSGWGGPRWTFFLSFIPCHAGLIRITEPARLKPLYEELSATSITDLFYVPRGITPLVIEKISSRKRDFAEMLADEKEYVFVSAEQDDMMQDGIDCYFLYQCRIGSETAGVIRTVFTGLR